MLVTVLLVKLEHVWHSRFNGFWWLAQCKFIPPLVKSPKARRVCGITGNSGRLLESHIWSADQLIHHTTLSADYGRYLTPFSWSLDAAIVLDVCYSALFCCSVLSCSIPPATQNPPLGSVSSIPMWGSYYLFPVICLERLLSGNEDMRQSLMLLFCCSASKQSFSLKYLVLFSIVR